MTDGSALAFWQFVPVVLFVCLFVYSLIIRFTAKRATQPLKDYDYRPLVSVLLPVYNEGPHVMKTIKSILAVDWPADKLEIVAVDDRSSDDSYAWLRKACRRYPGRFIRIGRRNTNRGKHAALMSALKASRGEIVICIDSDCIFDKNVVRELVACFADDKVAVVGGHVGVSNVNENVYTVCQTVMYFVGFQLMKMVQNARGKMFCVSGCLFAARREVFEDCGTEVKNRRWFGMEMRDGEDLYTTHTVLLRGWKTIFNPEAVCWTSVPATGGKLFAQQLRWRRSGLRDLLWVLSSLMEHLRAYGVRSLLSFLLVQFFVVFWAFYSLSMIQIWGVGEVFFAVGRSVITFGATLIFVALAYNQLIKRIAVGSKPIKKPWLAGLIGIWCYMDFMIITILALFTLDVGAWGTRDIKNNSKDSEEPIPPSARIKNV